MNAQIEKLMLEAAAEIDDLRRRNERQAIRLTAIDDMLMLVSLKKPGRGEGYELSQASELRRFVDEQKAREASMQVKPDIVEPTVVLQDGSFRDKKNPKTAAFLTKHSASFDPNDGEDKY